MSKPRVTEAPTLTLEGSNLVGHNGGWLAESGPVTKYLFRFICDGKLVKGGSIPAQSDASTVLPGQYPEDPQANVLAIAGLVGQSCYVEVAGGTVSDYTFSGGKKVIEWGDPARSNTLVIPAQAEPPAAVNAPAALALLENMALPELLASWAYRETKRTNPKVFAQTHVGKSEQAIRDAAKYLKATP